MEDEEYVANDDSSVSEDEIVHDDTEEEYKLEQQNGSRNEMEMDDGEDYGLDETSSEPDDEDDERPSSQKKRSRHASDDPKPEEEIVVKPFNMADRYKKAQIRVDTFIKDTLHLTEEIGPSHFASVDHWNRFCEDCSLFVYNLANNITENETLRELKLRLSRLEGPALPSYTEEDILASKRQAIAVNLAELQFKIDKRVKPLINAAQPLEQGGRDKTLAAAQKAREQLKEAAKWLAEEETIVDEKLSVRKIRADAPVKDGNTARLQAVKASTQQQTQATPVDMGPKPLGPYPPEKKGKDESELATGYSGRIIEERRQRELTGGLSLSTH